MSKPHGAPSTLVLVAGAMVVGAMTQLAFRVVGPVGINVPVLQSSEPELAVHTGPLPQDPAGMLQARRARQGQETRPGGREDPPQEAVEATRFLPKSYLDSYRELLPREYERLIAPVRMRPSMFSIAEPDARDSRAPAAVSVGSEPLELAVKEAVLRRGDVRLPADKFMMVGIALNELAWELQFGQIPSPDLADPRLTLRSLLVRAGLKASLAQPSSAAYGEGVRLADEYLRDRFRMRLREQERLASYFRGELNSEARGNLAFILIAVDGKGLLALERGADPELDTLLSEYSAYPATLRAELARILTK